VGGTARRLHVGGAPRFRTHSAQKRRCMERPGTHFHIVGLQHDATSIRPVFLQCKNQVLKGTRRGGSRHECSRNKVSEYSDAAWRCRELPAHSIGSPLSKNPRIWRNFNSNGGFAPI